MKTKYVLFFSLVLTIMACSGHADFERRLAVADTLMLTFPDSAYRMLCFMNNEAESVPVDLRMRHLLLRSNAQNKAYIPFTSDSIGIILTDYYKNRGSYNERMLAYYIKGCIYRDLGDWPSALECFNNAVENSVTDDANLYQLSIIYEQIAKIFVDFYMYDNAIRAYELAEYYAREIGDSIGIFTIWVNKATAYMNNGEVDLGMSIKEKASGEFRKKNLIRYAARAKAKNIKWNARRGNFAKAKAIMDEYEANSGYFLENGDIKPGKEDYYHIKGTYYEEKGDLDSAVHYFRKLQRTGTSLNDHYLASLGLTRVFRKWGQQDSVAKYAWNTFQLSDSLYNVNVAHNLQRTQSMYDYSRHQEAAHRKELEAERAQSRMVLVLVVGGVLLAGVIQLAFRHRKKLNRKIDGLKGEIRTRMAESACRERQLKENITEKSKIIASLNRQLNENAVNLSNIEHMRETVRILKEEVARHKQEIEAFTSARKHSCLEKEPAVTEFLQIVKRRKERPGSELWNKVFLVVEEYYPGMLALKKRYEITPNEYRICVLVKLGLGIKDMMFVENTYNGYLSSTRGRLMKKVSGSEGGAKNFDSYIREI